MVTLVPTLLKEMTDFSDKTLLPHLLLRIYVDTFVCQRDAHPFCANQPNVTLQEMSVA